MATTTDRFRPSRAGIINLWDYVDEEFVFADGRLALRGHNGSGKTKALEVLFPFVLDGSLDARRLDPFSGENRTMKANLLYRGEESRYGYVWLEFARPASAPDAPEQTVTLVVGLSAHRNWDRPKASFFVTDRRLGIGFGLLGPDSRPLTAKQLTAVLGREARCANRSDYQAKVSEALFGLPPERYAQLLDLLIALRRPLLAKDLDPVKVSDTLTAGLSPVDDELVEQAARDLENLRAVQEEYDSLVAADTAVAAFLAQYTDYLRVVVRHRADALAARIERAGEHVAALGAARIAAASAESAHAATAQRHEDTERALGILGAEHAALTTSEPYAEHGRLIEQRDRLDGTARDLARERARLATAGGNVADLGAEAERTEQELRRVRESAARGERDLAEAAARAGFEGDAAGAGQGAPAAAFTARVAGRRTEIGEVRAALAAVTAAGQRRGLADEQHARALAAVGQREQDYRTADDAVTTARDAAAGLLREWTRRRQAGSAGPGNGGDAGPDGPVFVDAVTAETLSAALDRIGEPDAPGLAETFAALMHARQLALVEDRTRLRGEADATAAEAAKLRAERAAIAAEHDDAPPASDLRPAERAGRAGAPLWRLVRFAEGVPDGDAAAIEGALYGAGLLTAWLHPEPAATGAALAAREADGFLVALPEHARPHGRTLADVLVAERQELVPGPLITAVLASIAVHATIDVPGQDAPGAAGAADVTATRAVPAATADAGTAIRLPRQAAPRDRSGHEDGGEGAGGDAAARPLADARVGAHHPSGAGAAAEPARRAGGPPPAARAPEAHPAEVSAPDADRAFAAVVTTGAAFALGPLVGTRPRRAPAFIGATNRAERRRARLADLDERIAMLTARHAALTAVAERIDTVLAGVDRARAELPPTRPIAAALAALAHAATRLADANGRLGETRAEADTAVAAVDACRRALRTTAGERGLPAEAAGLDAVARAVDDYERAAHDLRGAHGAVAGLGERLAEQRARVDRLAAQQHDEVEALAERGAAHAEALAELAVREAAVGEDYAAISARIDDVATRRDDRRAELKRLTDDLGEQRDALVRARGDAEHEHAALATALDELRERAAEFAPVCHPDLRPLLGIGEPTRWPEAWPATAEVLDALAARAGVSWSGAGADAVREALPEGAAALLAACRQAAAGRRGGDGAARAATDAVWEAFRTLEGALRTGENGYQPQVTGQQPLMVDILAADGRAPIAAFAARIAEDARDQGTLLERREQEVLEDALLGALARQIFDRVVAAKDLVRAMDADTRAKPMSSGTVIGIRWARADHLDDTSAAAARLLETEGRRLGDDKLARLRGLIRDMIRAHRARHPRDTYREALAAVLDYRAWHTFQLWLTRPGQQPEQLSRRRHSQMSGGEKSASIHMPLFAAANALYDSARPECPRMIALDEAFAGIDDRFTPELLGLTVKFGLDLFMTGHDLWVRYPEVPMAAHYDLRHDQATHTVSTLLVLWDGEQLVDAAAGFAKNDDLVRELLGFVPSRHAPALAAADGLAFGAGGDAGGDGEDGPEGEDGDGDGSDDISDISDISGDADSGAAAAAAGGRAAG